VKLLFRHIIFILNRLSCIPGCNCRIKRIQKWPSDFLQNPNQKLFQFQAIAVQIAARYLYKRNGVLIGDVVGLGKTLMATALCRIFQDDYHTETLIICPKNLRNMWQHYKHAYRLVCDIISVSEINDDFV